MESPAAGSVHISTMTTIFPPAPRHPSCPASGRLSDLPVLRETEDAKGLLLHLPILNVTVVPDSQVHLGWKCTVTESCDPRYSPSDIVMVTDLEIRTAIELDGDAHEALVQAFNAPDPADARDMFEHATEFTFAPAGSRPTDHDFFFYLVKVRYRYGSWTVTNLDRSWNGSAWERETGNEPDGAPRYDRDTALRLARQLVETVEHRGLTWVQLAATR